MAGPKKVEEYMMLSSYKISELRSVMPQIATWDPDEMAATFF